MMKNSTIALLSGAIPAIACLVLAACQAAPLSVSSAAPVVRYASAGPAAVISKAVEVPAGQHLLFVSGNTPLPAQPEAEQYSAAYWGDTEAQTRSALKKIDATLKEAGLTMADVVKAQVFLVAPAGAAVADQAGFAKGYTAYFGAYSNGKLPSRTVVQVAALGRPGMLIEVEVTAARPAATNGGAVAAASPAPRT
jgi:enamine deaminase RidA (YjgF/YER057c/UK114 family)